MSAALEFASVGLRFGEREILCELDLELSRGEVLGLIGPNGAGKTSLLRLATRVLRPDAGSVRIDGEDVAGLSRRNLAQRVAIVPQESSIPFPFRAIEIVLMGRSPHLGPLGFESHEDHELARSAMQRVGIEALAERSILTLSGGERQLVMVARALAQDADLLLFDEPTAFLDLRHRALVLDLARNSVRDGRRGALVVSHDLSLAARYCDCLALLGRGKILAVGPPTQVLRAEPLREAFGLDVEVISAPDGAPVVVPQVGSQC